MHQLIYVSTARRSVDQHDVGRILAAARRRNPPDRVTGLLAFDGARFLQVLEGDRDAVGAAYARIRVDPRHRAPLVISSRDIAAREFGDWSMAWSRVATIDQRLPLAKLLESLIGQAGDPGTRAMFRDFARTDRRKAA